MLKRDKMLRKIEIYFLTYLGAFAFLGIVIEAVLLLSKATGRVISPGLVALLLILVFLTVVLLFSVFFGWKNHTGKTEFVKRLATFPGKHNYNWQGGYSVLTFGLLHLVMLLRAVSCLQLCKQVYRRLLSSGRDIRSKRPNVSPLMQEIYFLIWAVVLILQLHCGTGDFLRGADIYFIIESLTWIFYYSVFRRFFEENYSIYHVLEHLPLVILLIPLQAIACALALSSDAAPLGWKNVLTVLLGEAQENQILFSFIGFLYSAIVISMILSIFPAEAVKRGNPHTIIVGAGDVVKNRLLPAILKRESSLPENRRGRIRIYDLASKSIIRDILDEEGRRTWERLKQKETDTLPVYALIETKRSSDDLIAWICTPSDAHWYYVDMLQDKADFIAVEKPLASDRNDLECFKSYIQTENRQHTFFLSYYLLEKALPLTFLCRPRELYLKYLAGEDGRSVGEYYQSGRESIASGVTAFEMAIKEGEDNRKLPPGGQLVETFVHLCLVASLFTGTPQHWETVVFTGNGSDLIKMTAKTPGGADIRLSLEKNGDHNDREEQTARIRFADGAVIEADFKQKRAVYRKENTRLSVRVAEPYQGKYDVQCCMVYECYANKVDPAEVDGLYHQIEILEWLFSVKNG